MAAEHEAIVASFVNVGVKAVHKKLHADERERTRQVAASLGAGRK